MCSLCPWHRRVPISTTARPPGRAWVFISPWLARCSCRLANTLPCAHAGTPLGDPIEVGALGAAFAVGKDVASRTRILGLVSSKVC